MKRRLKDLVLRVLGPLLGRIDARVNERVDAHLAENWGAGRPGDLTASVLEVQRGIDDLESRLRPVLDTIETRNAADRAIARAMDDLRRDVDDLQTRLGGDVRSRADG